MMYHQSHTSYTTPTSYNSSLVVFLPICRYSSTANLSTLSSVLLISPTVINGLKRTRWSVAYCPFVDLFVHKERELYTSVCVCECVLLSISSFGEGALYSWGPRLLYLFLFHLFPLYIPLYSFVFQVSVWRGTLLERGVHQLQSPPPPHSAGLWPLTTHLTFILV